MSRPSTDGSAFESVHSRVSEAAVSPTVTQFPSSEFSQTVLLRVFPEKACVAISAGFLCCYIPITTRPITSGFVVAEIGCGRENRTPDW